MDTETNHTVEAYDNATGEHYTRPANAEELAYYEQLEAEQATTELGSDNDD